MIGWGVVLGLAAAIVLLAARGVLPDVFTDDAPVAALTTFLLLWVAALQPLNGAVFVLDGLLIGAGDQRYLAKAMVAVLLAFAPCALVVMLTGAGIGWLWAALAVLMSGRLVALRARWRTGAWAVT